VDPTTSWSAAFTIDDVVDVLREEATEDVYKLAGNLRRGAAERSTAEGGRPEASVAVCAFGGGLLGAL